MYRSDKPQWLIGKKKRAKYYKFASIPHMLQRFKHYEYDYEDQIRTVLEIFPEPPQVYPVQVRRLRRIVRKVMQIEPKQETKEREKECPKPMSEFNSSVISEPTQK